MEKTKIVRAPLNLELTMAIWWDFAWKSTLLSLVIAMILGFMIGVIAFLFQPDEAAAAITGVVAWLSTIPVGIFMLRRSLSRSYGDYSIIIVKKEPEQLTEILEVVQQTAPQNAA